MKRVLVIGHFWPYHPGGSKRVLGLAKYLPEFGWEPIVLTATLCDKPDFQCRVIETLSRNTVVEFKKFLRLNPKRGFQEQLGIPSKIIHKKASPTARIAKLFEAVITYPDIESGWKSFALEAVKKCFLTERVDALLSVWPITAHIIAKGLKEEYKLPWLADFPDLWSETYAYSYGRIRKWFDRNLEKRTLRRADILTTSSWPQTEVMRNIHGRQDILTITIGFDPEKINEPPMPLTEKFTITYTGIFYGENRNPSKFFEALHELLSEKLIIQDDVQVRLYGPPAKSVEMEIEKLNLSPVVKQHGVVPWEECLKRQRESQLLLQLNWENKKEKGAYSGKITEYLAARRPVLSVGGWGNDVTEELFQETKVGAYCPNVMQIKEALLKYYLEYKQRRKVIFQGDISRTDKYSYREMAKKFATLLNLICSK